MTKKIKLMRPGYGGLPYPEGSILALNDDEGHFIVNSGAAIYVDEYAPVTPPPGGEVIDTFTKNAKAAEEQRKKALSPEARRKEEQAEKDAEQKRKDEEEKAKEDEAKAKAALAAAQKAEDDKMRISQPQTAHKK